MNNICPPCIIKTDEPTQNIGVANSVVYKKRKDNLGNLLDEEFNKKETDPNYFINSGNNDFKTATDRFNVNSYNKMAEELINLPLDLPPELE